jgi:hypothetical protein
MIDRMSLDSSDNIIGFIATGKLTEEDYTRVVIPEINQAISKHGKIKMLLKVENFEGWTLRAAIEDVKLITKIGHLDRIAVVGEENLNKMLVGMFEFLFALTGAEIKFFREQRYDEALNWLETGS